MLKLKGVLSRKVAAVLRRMREGPLPEVREVDWSEWEQSVAAWDDAAIKLPDAAAASATSNECPLAPAAADVVHADWAVWEESVQAIERARQRRVAGG